MTKLLTRLINGPAHYTQTHHLSNGLTLVVIFIGFLAEILFAYAALLIVFKIVQNTRPFINLVLRLFGVGAEPADTVFLELIPPRDTSKSAFATKQLHILLRHHNASPNTWYRFAAYKQLHSLELYSTHDSGIRYVIGVPKSEEIYVTHSLRAYLPGLKISTIDDYVTLVTDSTIGVIELSLSADFVLPLQDHTALEEHDLMAYLTGHMTKLVSDELIGYQIITTPVSSRTHHRVTRHVRSLQNRIAAGKEVGTQLVLQRSVRGQYLWLLWYPLYWTISTMLKLLTIFYELLVAMFSKEHTSPQFMQSAKDKLRADNPYDTELSNDVKNKLDQPLFEVSLRVLVASSDTKHRVSRLNAIVASFQPLSTTRQTLMSASTAFLHNDELLYERYKSRSLTPHFPDQQTIVSSSELSDLYHFPITDLTKTEGLVKSRSPELSAPLSIKRSDTELDVVVGVNEHGGDKQPIGMTLAQRQKHTYVIGKTGTGKTTLLTSSIYQDMVNNKGLAVLDPHGDMFQDLLRIIPEHRRKDVVVFDPSDEDYPIGLNLLDPGISFGSEKEKQQRITSNVIAVFTKLADPKQWGPRMEHILRSTTMTALQLPNPNLFTLQRLLTEKNYQKRVAANLKDPVLRQFWSKEFALLGSMQLSSASAPLTNRLGHFMTTIMSRHILLQEKSTISISDVMDEGKILLVNVSKGDIGEDQSTFFGTIITSFIWMAAYQRTRVAEKDRKDFFLYVDEFQNFATPDFSDISSEGRKYHVPLIVSHQNIAQIEDKAILKTVVGNAHSIISFKASPEDEAFILPTMQPEVSKSNIVNLTPYHFYMKTTSDVSEDAFSGLTVPLNVERSDKIKDEVIALSRKQYGTPVKKVEQYMEQLFGQEEPKKLPKAKTIAKK